jgi:hypothetical protein
MFVQQYISVSWYSTRTSDTLLRYCTAVDGLTGPRTHCNPTQPSAELV